MQRATQLKTASPVFFLQTLQILSRTIRKAIVSTGTAIKREKSKLVVWMVVLNVALSPVLSYSQPHRAVRPRQLQAPSHNSLFWAAFPNLPTQIQPRIFLDKEAIQSVVFAESGKKNLDEGKKMSSHLPALMMLVDAYKQTVNPIVKVSGIKQVMNFVRTSNSREREFALDTAGAVITSIAPYFIKSSVPGLIYTAGSIAIKGFETKMQNDIEEAERKYLPPTVRQIAKPLQGTNAKQHRKELAGKTLREAHALAQKNDKFRQDFDAIFKDTLGVSILATTQEIIVQNKLDLPDYFRTRIQPDGSATFELGLLQKSYSDDFKSLIGITEEGIANAKEISDQQGSLTQAQRNQQNDAALKAKQEQKYRDNVQKLNTLSTSVSLVSEIASYIDPKAARHIEVVGGAGIRLASAINDFNNSAVNLFTNAALNSVVSGALLTGNVVAIGLQLFSLFGGGGSSPEALILEQIQKLREEVQELRKEMHERFDRVDEKLDQIYERLDYGLAHLDGNLNEVSRELIGLHADLNRLEGNIYNWLDAGFRRPLLEGINGGIGYKERTSVDMPYRPDYINYENLFYSWNTTHSKDALQAGVDGRNYNDSEIYDELNNYPLDANINFLAQFPSENLKLPALANSRLANPNDWRISSEAYLQIAREWPDHDKLINPNRLKAVYDVGLQLRDAVENVTTLRTNSGVKANRQLFDSLIAKYRGKANVLAQAIKKVEDDYKADPANSAVKDVNIWGDANQSTSFTFPTPDKPLICGPGSPDAQIPTPSNISRIDNAMPNPVRLAAKLGAWKVEYCWRFDFGGAAVGSPTFNMTIRLVGGHKMIYGGPDSEELAMLSLGGLYTPSAGYFALIGARWNSYYKDNFEKNATLTVTMTNAQVKKAIDAANAALRNHQRNVITKTLNEFSKAGAIQSAARELSGSKVLLDAYIALGLSRSLESNDLLHSLLYGSEKMADENTVKDIYENALVALSEGKTIPRVDITNTVNPRTDALAKVLQEILGEIDQYHRDKQRDLLYYNYPESLSALENTLQDVQIHNREVTTGNTVVAHPQSLTTSANQAVGITLFGSDTKGASLTYSIIKQPAHGTLTGNLPELLYTPEKDYSGKDSFTFCVYNGSQYSNEATVSITVDRNLCSGVSFNLPYFHTLSKAANYGVKITPATSAAPYDSAIGDFNGDGKPDLAVANWGSDEVAILLGDGAGGFGTATYSPPTIRRAYSIAVGDFNSDGKSDLAVTQNDGITNQVAVLLGDGTGKFGTPTKFPVGAVPYGIATGDFNKDGKIDLVVVNHDSHNLSLLVGDGQGRFAAAKNFAVGTSPAEIAVADFNKDGNIDVAVTNSDTHNISILLGNGQGSFSAPTNYGVGRFPVGIVIGDVNGDTKLDLAISNTDTKDVSILLGDGAGRFGTAVNYTVGIRAFALAAFDFNRDGKLDLISTDDATGRVAILRGNGNGSFILDGAYSVDTGVTSVQVNDLNKDSVPDLVFTNLKSNDVSVRLSNGMSDFNTPPDISVGTRPYTVVVEDFNRDGKPDIATANLSSNNVSVALGSGNGNFSKATNYATGTRPLFVISGDFNNDKNPDLAVTNLGTGGTLGSGGVSILIGDGTGKFTKSTDIRTFKEPFALATGDFNRDGKLDLAVTDAFGVNAVPNNVSILLGNGAGGFAQGAMVTAGGTPIFVSTIDINRDSKLDLLVTNSNTNDVSILLGNGSGGFTNVGSFSTADGPVQQVVDDFDKDGYSDLAQLNKRSNYQAAVMLGAEGGRFEGFTNYALAPQPSAAIAGDFDLDGNLDLAIGHEQANGLIILSGNGYGIFGNPSSFGTGFESVSIAKGDFNQDGKLDLVVANYNNNSVSVLLNTTCISLTPVANVATVSAASYANNGASSESIVSAFGQGLATNTQLAISSPLPTTLAGTTVKIKDSVNSEWLAPLFFVSPGQVNYLIPQGTVTGLATITITNGTGNVSTGPVLITSIAPGVFSADASGKGYAAANFVRVTTDNRLVEQPVARFDSLQNKIVATPIEFTADTRKIVLVLFGTGWRQRSSPTAVTVKIGGVTAPVEYVGLQPGYEGLDQINVEIPRTLAGRGDVDVAITVDGVSANLVKVNIK